MFDNELMLRAASAGNLTGDETGSFKFVGKGNIVNVRFMIPSTSGTDTLDCELQFGTDGTNANGDKVVIAQLSATKRTKDVKIVAMQDYVRAYLNVTDSGGGVNFGAVQVGIVPAGQHTDF